MNIAFSMTEFIINDNPQLSAMDAIRISCRLTKGFKWEIFVMYLSFILWYLLVIISYGLANLYVQPYLDITLTMYYENLKKNALDSGIVSYEEFGLNRF